MFDLDGVVSIVEKPATIMVTLWCGRSLTEQALRQLPLQQPFGRAKSRKISKPWLPQVIAVVLMARGLTEVLVVKLRGAEGLSRQLTLRKWWGITPRRHAGRSVSAPENFNGLQPFDILKRWQAHACTLPSSSHVAALVPCVLRQLQTTVCVWTCAGLAHHTMRRRVKHLALVLQPLHAQIQHMLESWESCVAFAQYVSVGHQYLQNKVGVSKLWSSQPCSPMPGSVVSCFVFWGWQKLTNIRIFFRLWVALLFLFWGCRYPLGNEKVGDVSWPTLHAEDLVKIGADLGVSVLLSGGYSDSRWSDLDGQRYTPNKFLMLGMLCCARQVDIQTLLSSSEIEGKMCSQDLFAFWQSMFWNPSRSISSDNCTMCLQVLSWLGCAPPWSQVFGQLEGEQLRKIPRSKGDLREKGAVNLSRKMGHGYAAKVQLDKASSDSTTKSGEGAERTKFVARRNSLGMKLLNLRDLEGRGAKP